MFCRFPSSQPPFYSRNTAEMYNNILHKSPVLKPNVSNAGRELLEGLLQKDRTKRLGVKDDFVSEKPSEPKDPVTHGDPRQRFRDARLSICLTRRNVCVPLQLELKFHSFFSPINWEDLMAKRIVPPFVPSVVSSNSRLQLVAFCLEIGLKRLFYQSPIWRLQLN